MCSSSRFVVGRDWWMREDVREQMGEVPLASLCEGER
jgi:hypothetical protein